MSRRTVQVDVSVEKHSPCAQPAAQPPRLAGDQLAVALRDALALKRLKPSASRSTSTPKPTKRGT